MDSSNQKSKYPRNQKNKYPSHNFSSHKDKGKKPAQKEWPKRSKQEEEDREECRRKHICYHCRERWERGHCCLGKGKVHFVEVRSKSEDIDDEGKPQNDADNSSDEEQPHDEGKSSTVATLSGTPRFNSFRVRGSLQG